MNKHQTVAKLIEYGIAETRAKHMNLSCADLSGATAGDGIPLTAFHKAGILKRWKLLAKP